MNSDTRTTIPKRLQKSSATTTQTPRRGAKALHRLRFQDKLGELAAAFDGLAETLRERESLPQNNKTAFKDPAKWLSTLARFNGLLRACPDRPSIERVLAETVEEVFPACAIALCLNDKRMPPESRNGFHRPKAESLSEHGWIFYVTIPLVARGEALGALSVYGRERGGLGPLELDFLNVLAEQAASAIEQFRLLEQASAQAVQSRHGGDVLGESDQAKSDFVSIISHEFRTPLNLIMGYTEMMQEELMGKITAEQGRCLERIMKASDDLLTLVMNMLQVGNIESGCVEINKGKVGLSQLLREVQSDFVLPEEKSLEFIWDIPADLPIVSTDAEQLKRIVQQLIGNAIKFTERGHVMVSSRSVLPAGRVEITISDTGVGIPERVLPVLFEKYRQLDSTIARTYDGVGLGLFIAKKLTEVLGGELRVTSEPGKGSTFTVALPVGI
jgi:signal transduction histidine kinase